MVDVVRWWSCSRAMSRLMKFWFEREREKSEIIPRVLLFRDNNHNPTPKNLLYAAARELSRRIMGEEAGDDTMVYKTQQKFSKVHWPATTTPMAGDD
ncbi:hypothetical protein Hanom_Chr07g00647931 [Helianthus anomalus]